MKRQMPITLLLALVSTAVGCAHLPQSAPMDRTLLTPPTALDAYVDKPDPSYSYRVLQSAKSGGATFSVIDMTSQTWRTPEEVDRVQWRHWLTIVKPDTVTTGKALLFISGGDNGGEAPQAPSPLIAQIAMATQSVTAELHMIPNQPLTFIADETQPRGEDALVAYTWDKYLRTGDATWPARLPMTKAAVRAMDTITNFCASARGGNVTVDAFVVAGGSKRGLTAWTAAAVDPRVVAICPIVIDMLNMAPSLVHHFEAYGFWAPTVDDYVERNLMDWLGHPKYDGLLKIIDPYSYRDRMTLPKFIINASGDQLFLPDSSQFYYDDLPGEKLLRYVPNAAHDLGGSDAIESLLAYYHAILNEDQLPRYSWTVKNNAIHVKTKDNPVAVKLWQATNPKARDFRFDYVGGIWTSTDLEETKPGRYVGSVPIPEEGWTAFFVELTFKNDAPAPLKVTTQVHVVPQILPYTYTPRYGRISR